MNKNIFKKLDNTKTKDNVVYIIKVQLDNGLVLHKIGVTGYKREVDRMLEVLKGFFIQYRYVPFSSLKRFKRFSDAYAIEKLLHNEFVEYKYTFDKTFGGSTEFFLNIDEAKLIEFYDKIHSNQHKD